jgi:diguanylate cyclase (GGDEF)-like protein
VITSVLVWSRGATIDIVVPSVVIAIIVPLLVAPVASGVLARLLASLDHATSEMVVLARTDPLTSLRNRRAFFDDAVVLVGGVNAGLFLAVMIDVDAFKSVNDTHGHSVGDRVLQHLAGNLTGAVSGHAVVGRLGGDEFAVVAPVDSADVASAMVEQIRAACDLGGVVPGLRASLGFVVSPPRDIDALLADADRILYHGKRANEV